MTREKRAKYTLTEPITLADLRWLVEQSNDLAPETPVTTTEHKSYNQREWDPATIVVNGAVD